MPFSYGPERVKSAGLWEDQVRQRGLNTMSVPRISHRYRSLGSRLRPFYFSLTSRRGMLVAIREAMVNCLPIVCSDAGGIPEMITDGIHGLMFPARDTDALCARLSDAGAHPDKMRSLAARARARIEDFSAERMVENYLTVFESCASPAHGVGSDQRPRIQARSMKFSDNSILSLAPATLPGFFSRDLRQLLALSGHSMSRR